MKEGNPAYVGAYVKTRFRKTGLVKGTSSYTTARHSTSRLGKLRASSQEKSSLAIVMTGASKPTPAQPWVALGPRENSSLPETQLRQRDTLSITVP